MLREKYNLKNIKHLKIDLFERCACRRLLENCLISSRISWIWSRHLLTVDCKVSAFQFNHRNPHPQPYTPHTPLTLSSLLFPPNLFGVQGVSAWKLKTWICLSGTLWNLVFWIGLFSWLLKPNWSPSSRSKTTKERYSTWTKLSLPLQTLICQNPMSSDSGCAQAWFSDTVYGPRFRRIRSIIWLINGTIQLVNGIILLINSGQSTLNLLISRLIMVHGSWWLGPSLGPGAGARPPCPQTTPILRRPRGPGRAAAMSYVWTIDNRLINRLMLKQPEMFLILREGGQYRSRHGHNTLTSDGRRETSNWASIG